MPPGFTETTVETQPTNASDWMRWLFNRTVAFDARANPPYRHTPPRKRLLFIHFIQHSVANQLLLFISRYTEKSRE
jgi:hypothetical protein